MSAATSTNTSNNSGEQPVTSGIIANEEQAAIDAIRQGLVALGIDPGTRPIDLRTLPFEGTWGSASTICRILAGDVVTNELRERGELDDLSKKQIKQKVNEHVAGKSQEIAEGVVASIAATGRFARVEAENGYINVYYDANSMAARLAAEVLGSDLPYGWAPQGTHPDRVMIEHSQLNTHKAAHVGHLRNICIGVAVTNISRAAGYTTMPVTYIGDIGRHVIQCMWCYNRFHAGEEPTSEASRGQWLGDIYAESSARLGFRKEAVAFLQALVLEDQIFVAAIDRMLKFLWRQNTTEGEDIAYLLGRISHQLEIEVHELRDENVIVNFWPIIGQQLKDELALAESSPEEAADHGDRTNGANGTKPAVEQTMPPEARVEQWERIDAHMRDWWPNVPQWEQEIKETFQLWEEKDPDLVALWEQTREWSLADLRRIFDEFGAVFDHWFFESGVEDAGRQIVRELLEREIAEISDGLPVVKIDEKLGLEQEKYHTMPVLRSDGTTLYSTKDLALTQQKFNEFGVDQAIWVVDVRQSLYFDQISKILELYGFEQARQSLHLGYEFVSLPSGVMSSRKGTAPLLEDVRDAMMAEAVKVIEDKNVALTGERRQTVAHQVAIGAIKYAMLARDFNKVIVFDPDEALSFDGHAAPYIQYAHARACRILENAAVTDAQLRDGLATLNFGQPASEELGLLQVISEFPGMVQRAAEEHRPLHMTNYVYELAKRFNDFYHACPVLHSEEPVRSARLTLVAATRTTLRNGLDLLGIAAPEHM